MQNSVVAEASLQPETGKENHEAEQAEEIEYFDPADGQEEIEIHLPE